MLTVYEDTLEKIKEVYEDVLGSLGYTFTLSVEPFDFRVFDGDKELPREEYNVFGFEGFKFKGTRGENIYLSGDSKLEIYIPGDNLLEITVQYTTWNFSKNISIEYCSDKKTMDRITFCFNDFRPSSPRRIITDVEKYTTHYEFESKSTFTIEQYKNAAKCYIGLEGECKPKDLPIDADTYMNSILTFVHNNKYINLDRIEQGLEIVYYAMRKRLEDFQDERLCEAEFKVYLANLEKERLIEKKEATIARIDKLIKKKDKEIVELALERDRIKDMLSVKKDKVK